MKRFGLNTISNIIARLWSMVAIYLFIPFYISILGESAYGLVSFFATLHSALSILGLGLSNTLRREYALGNQSEENRQRKYNLLRSVEVIYLGIGILIFLLCFAGAGFISNHWLNIEALPASLVETVISLMGVSISLQLISNLYAGCLFGLEHQVQANILCVLWSAAKNIGALAVIYFIAPDLRWFYGWHIVTDFIYLVSLRICVKKHLAITQKQKWSFRDMRNLSTIWGYTLGLFLISMIALVNRQLDKIVISKFLTLTELGAYTSSTTLGNLSAIIPAAIYTAIFPRFTKSVSAGATEKLLRDFNVANRIVNITIACFISFIGLFSVQLIRVWTGSQIYADMLHVVGCLVVFAVGITEFQQIPYALALAHGNTKINVLVGAIFIPVLGVFTWFAIKNYGLLGAGLVYFITASAQTLLYEYLVYRKYAAASPVKLVLKDTLFPVAVSFASAYISRRLIIGIVRSVLIQCVLAVFAGALTLALMLFFMSGKDLKMLIQEIKHPK